MNMKKLAKYFKLVILLFSILFSSCEKENIFDSQETSIQNRFEKRFNKESFKQTLPFSYQVNWENSIKQYSEELKTDFYEFDLIYNTPFNPTTINKSKKEGYNIFYKLIVTESKENKLAFFVGKFFQKKDGSTEIEDLNISLNNNSSYKGFTHLYDKNNELYFAKKINDKEVRKPKLYFKDKVEKDNSELYSKGDVTTCTTSTLYHYIDWYKYTYDVYGNLISVVYLYTEYVGSSNTTSCTTEFQPEEPIRIIKNPNHFPCNDGTGRTNCVKNVEPQIMCEIGFMPDKNGNCTEITNLLEEEYFRFSEQLDLTDKQENWINDLKNKQAKDAITKYLSSFILTAEFDKAKIFAKEAIQALMSFNSINYPGKTEGLPFEWWKDNNLIDTHSFFNKDPYNVWRRLTQKEKEILKLYPAAAIILNRNKTIAEQRTYNSYGKNGLNDNSDAFRHAYFNALNSRDMGKWLAKKLSDAHESETPAIWSLEVQMDLFNNNIGHQAGYSFSNKNDIEMGNLIKDKINNGLGRYLSPINYSDPNFSKTHGISFLTVLTPTD